jgi:hypothetical protein
MENKRSKKQRLKVPEAAVEVKPSQQISFEMFFAKSIQEGKLKPWQHKEILAFFKDMGLREKEDLKVYEDTLGKF